MTISIQFVFIRRLNRPGPHETNWNYVLSCGVDNFVFQPSSRHTTKGHHRRIDLRKCSKSHKTPCEPAWYSIETAENWFSRAHSEFMIRCRFGCNPTARYESRTILLRLASVALHNRLRRFSTSPWTYSWLEFVDAPLYSPFTRNQFLLRSVRNAVVIDYNTLNELIANKLAFKPLGLEKCNTKWSNEPTIEIKNRVFNVFT